MLLLNLAHNQAANQLNYNYKIYRAKKKHGKDTFSGYFDTKLDQQKAAIYFLEKEDSLKKVLSFAGSANYSPVIVGIIENIRNNIKHKI